MDPIGVPIQPFNSKIVFSPGRSANPTPICNGDLSSLLKVLSTRLMLEPASMLMRFVSEIFRPPASHAS